MARPGAVGQRRRGEAGQGLAGYGMALFGMVRQGSLGMARGGWVWRGEGRRVNNRRGRLIKLIAECGSLHKGNIGAAMTSVHSAKEAGADAWKGIMSNPDELIAGPGISFGNEKLYDVIASYRLKDDEWREIAQYCRELGIDYYVTVGTCDYVPLAVEIGCSKLKVGAWDSRNFPLIDAVLDTGLPLQFDLSAVLVSETDHLFNYIRNRHFSAEVSLLYESHGELNLRSIPYLRDRYGMEVGFSSEGRDSLPDILAVGLGATIIEKRLTPFRERVGHHQDKALTGTEWSTWAAEIRKGQLMLGKDGLYPSLADVASKQRFFTSLVFNRDAKRGEIVTEDMMAARRPGNGLSPLYSYLFHNKRLARDVKRNEILTYGTCEETVDA